MRQYVVGGFEVDQKIDAMAAYHRFPENRMTIGTEGLLAGNVIVDADGNQSSLDYHSSFKNRIENYIVGKNPIVLQTKPEISAAREQTVGALGDVLGKPGETPKDIVGRWRRLDERQITRLVDWLRSVKGRS